MVPITTFTPSELQRHERYLLAVAALYANIAEHMNATDNPQTTIAEYLDDVSDDLGSILGIGVEAWLQQSRDTANRHLAS